MHDEKSQHDKAGVGDVSVAGLRAVTADDGVLALAGRVDVLSVAVLRELLIATIDAGIGDVVVDVAGLELVDATGLGALLSGHRRARRGGRRLVLRNPPVDLVRLLHRTRLSRVIVTEVEDPTDLEPSVVIPLPRLAAS
jgi:anti-anti-sigma factor